MTSVPVTGRKISTAGIRATTSFRRCRRFHVAQNSDTNRLNPHNNNVVFGELLGNAALGAYSLNYEREFYCSKSFIVTARLGGAYSPGLFNLPLLLNTLIGKTHHIELGFGVSIQYQKVSTGKHKTKWENLTGDTFRIGYRYQKPDGHFMTSICYTPTWYPRNKNLDTIYLYTYVFFGAAIGYVF